MKIAKNSRIAKEALKAVLFLITILCVQSCLLAAGAAAVGAGVVKGEYTENVSVSMATTDQAVRQAVSELHYIPINHMQDKISSTRLLRSGADDKITITLKELAAQATSITVRIGTFDDEA
ncbi:MAG: DUF3568 family protein [Lentisphaeraceae bacterium]|nr:DUF3568 family protein [Lentisphaeraceae bacterium]